MLENAVRFRCFRTSFEDAALTNPVNLGGDFGVVNDNLPVKFTDFADCKFTAI